MKVIAKLLLAPLKLKLVDCSFHNKCLNFLGSCDFSQFRSKMHTSLDRRKDSRRQKSKQSFQTKIKKCRILCHQRNTYEMKAEFLTFQSTYISLHTKIHEPRNVNFKRRRKFHGTSVFSAIQTSVECC